MMKVDIMDTYVRNCTEIEQIIKPLMKFNVFYECDEKEAKKVLLTFFSEYKKMKPCKKFSFKNTLGSKNSYYSFYRNLVPIMYALHNNEYARACNEIVTLVHNEFVLQKRIYAGMMFLYHKYLE